MAESLGIMPVGKHKGEEIEDIESSYLKWIIGEQWFKDQRPMLCEAIKKELKYREQFPGT